MNILTYFCIKYFINSQLSVTCFDFLEPSSGSFTLMKNNKKYSKQDLVF